MDNGDRFFTNGDQERFAQPAAMDAHGKGRHQPAQPAIKKLCDDGTPGRSAYYCPLELPHAIIVYTHGRRYSRRQLRGT